MTKSYMSIGIDFGNNDFDNASTNISHYLCQLEHILKDGEKT